MSYGIKVNDSFGKTVIDTSTETIKLIDWFDVEREASGSRKSPRYVGATIVIVGIEDFDSTTMRTTRAQLIGDTITYKPGDNYYTIRSRVMVFK